MMGLFNLFKKDAKNSQIVAVCTGEYVPNDKISDPMFAQNMMGQTLGFEPTDGTIVAPCDGTIESIFPTGHAFTIRMTDGTGLLVHVGIDTVKLKGEGFTLLKKEHDKVKAGDPVVTVDLAKVKAADLPTTTMIIVAEPVEGKSYNFIDYGPVTAGQQISC